MSTKPASCMSSQQPVTTEPSVSTKPATCMSSQQPVTTEPSVSTKPASQIALLVVQQYERKGTLRYTFFTNGSNRPCDMICTINMIFCGGRFATL